MMDNKIALASVAVSALAAVSTNTASAQTKSDKRRAKSRPNVIFILLDDAGYGDFGCYGQTKIETPNIDALAERGIRFTDMISLLHRSPLDIGQESIPYHDRQAPRHQTLQHTLPPTPLEQLGRYAGLLWST